MSTVHEHNEYLECSNGNIYFTTESSLPLEYGVHKIHHKTHTIRYKLKTFTPILLLKNRGNTYSITVELPTKQSILDKLLPKNPHIRIDFVGANYIVNTGLIPTKDR